ncbi:MAG: hypothetical protein ACU0DT_04370 [Albimonas sp.]|uniref:hypothetical protein n=1 Tax=Albimonas sp. TaxID=1872425 RepID=UPI004055EE64
MRALHAADAGHGVTPRQRRGQGEAGVARAIGAALREEVRLDAEARLAEPSSRGHRLPAMGRSAGDRGAFRQDPRPPRPARRQVDVREPLHAGRRRARLGDPPCDRGADDRDAFSRRPDPRRDARRRWNRFRRDARQDRGDGP